MSEGKKYDQDKLKVELLYNDLVNELETVAKVLSFGASKYGERNWRGVSKERYGAALIRHYNASVKGEKLDLESGQPHLAHLVCCALFMLYIENGESGSKPSISDFQDKKVTHFTNLGEHKYYHTFEEH
jgi:hypothetical protein